MDCPDCDSPTVEFAVPEEFRGFVPGDEPALALCSHCLALHPGPETAPNRPNPSNRSNPDFAAVSDSFPTGAAAVPMALAVGLLDSLALYRTEVETLLCHVERAGTDPLLVLDRLGADSSLDPQVALGVRRRQVSQFRD